MSFNFLSGLFNKANAGIGAGGSDAMGNQIPNIAGPMPGAAVQVPGAMQGPSMASRVAAMAPALQNQQAQQQAPPPMQLAAPQQIQAAQAVGVNPQAMQAQRQGLLMQQRRPAPGYVPGPLAGRY
jgi:hypothetical protein